MITVYRARQIHTMNPNRPTATHVAVRDGRILAVGDATCADQWGDVTHDDRLADAVLLPGFVEGHAHLMEGGIWDYAYMGYHDRWDPQGNFHRGKGDLATVIADMQAALNGLGADEPLVGWGLDPIFFTDERLSRAHLDQVAADRPIAIIFSSFHVMCVNSKALEMAGFDAHTNVEGVVKGPDGEPTGELQEMAAMFPIMRRLGVDLQALAKGERILRNYAKVCHREGVTTIVDLYNGMDDETVATLTRVTSEPGFPIRLVPMLGGMETPPAETAARALELRAASTDKLRMGGVKLVTDGSIQGWTARVEWPGYVGGQANGIWNAPPERLFDMVEALHGAGVQMHIHTNGDEASAVAMDAIQAASRKHGGKGHRHILQHAQMMGLDQFRRARELGVGVNLFANHIWYFGDKHVDQTIGRDRAASMDAVRSALDTGLYTAIHCDVPVTPLSPLFTAWCAVNRTTMSGQVLGASQCVSVPEALRLITLGAAETLRMDSDVGSIEVGKCADFAVLGDDPMVVDPTALKDVPVLGTVIGGEVLLK